MSRFRWKLLIGALLIVSLSLIAYALLTSTTHQITEPVISTGGDTISSPSYNLLASVGQTGTDTLSSASYTLNTGLYYLRHEAPVGTVGDSIVIVGEAHLVGTSGGNLTLVMDVKDSSNGGLVANASVNLMVEYEGSQVSTDSASADTVGRVSKSVTLSSGDGAYVITATRSAARAVFVVVTDKRRVPAHPTETPKSKWVMIAPFRKPAASLTGLNQLSYGGTPISYSYDPTIPTAHATFDRYKSVGNQSDSTNVSANGTFSQYESGRAYWFRSSAATSVGLAGSPAAVTQAFSVRLDSGANMIGNPFTHFIDWLDDVAVDTHLNDTPGPITLRNLTPAQMSATLDTRLQWRSQTAEQYVTPFASSETSVQMKPWVGFWVKANASCSIVYYPTKRLPLTTPVKQQAPAYLTETEKRRAGETASWRMRLMEYSDVPEIRDEYAFLGVAPSASDGEDVNDLWKAPGLFGDLQVLVGEAVSNDVSPSPRLSVSPSHSYYAASIAPPVKTATAWPVVVTPPSGVKSATLKWEAGGLPDGYEAYMIGGPAGPVNMRTAAAMAVAFSSPAKLTVVVGTPEYLAAYLAAPLSKENTFVYPNPGPDAAGNVTFKYNLQAAGDVQLKIFDVGGKLVKELAATGAAGSNTVTWDTTNKHGQKLGSGVYIYILQSGGTKLVDKLAVVR